MNLIYAIVLVIYTGPIPGKPLAWETTSYEMLPTFKTSFNCQRMAKTFNQQRGNIFEGKAGTRYSHIKGPIVGAWCTVPVDDRGIPPTKKVTK